MDLSYSVRGSCEDTKLSRGSVVLAGGNVVTKLKDRSSVSFIVFIELFEDNLGNLGGVVECAVLNELYGVRNSNYSCNAFVFLRTVEKSGRNEYCGCGVIANHLTGVNYTVDGLELVRTFLNVDVSEVRAVCEDISEGLVDKTVALRNVVKSILKTLYVSYCSCGDGKFGYLSVSECVCCDYDRISTAGSKRNGRSSLVGRRAGTECIRTDISYSAGNVNRVECLSVTEREVVNGSEAFVEGYRIKSYALIECSISNALKVSACLEGSELIVRGGSAVHCECISTDLGNSVGKLKNRNLGSVEYTRGVGGRTVSTESKCNVAALDIESVKRSTTGECTVANSVNVCRDGDARKCGITAECVSAYVSKCVGSGEACELRSIECIVADNGSVLGKSRDIGECALVERIVTDRKSCICSLGGLKGDRGEVYAVIECVVAYLSDALLDNDGLKAVVVGEYCRTDLNESIGKILFCDSAVQLSYASGGEEDKLSNCCVVKNTLDGLEVSVLRSNVNGLKSVTSAEYRAVEVGNGCRKVDLSKLGASGECIVTKGKSLASVCNRKGGDTRAVLECVSANLSGRCGNYHCTEVTASGECIVAYGKNGCVVEVNCGKNSLILECAGSDSSNVCAITEGNGSELSVNVRNGSECICTDIERAAIESAVSAAAEGNCQELGVVCECIFTDVKIILLSVTCEGDVLHTGAVSECRCADRLNEVGNSDRGDTGAVFERSLTDILDTGGNGEVAGYERCGNEDNSVLEVVRKKACNGTVVNVTCLNRDGRKCGKRLEHVNVDVLNSCGNLEELNVVTSVE